MIACLDVDYRTDHAIAACVLCTNWTDAASADEHVVRVAPVEPYIPGQFFRRELPCLMKVLSLVRTMPSVIVIDGYVWLDPLKKPGLGAHLYEALGRSPTVIGVAKTPFKNAPHQTVRRNASRELYVTAVGIDPSTAAAHIASMHGQFRIPTLLKRADSLCKITMLLPP